MPAQPNSVVSDPTIQASADELGVDRRTIRRLIVEGHLEGYRIKGTALIRVTRKSLDAIKQPMVGGAA